MIDIKNRGFTLTELIVTVVVLTVLMGILAPVLLTNWFSYEERIMRANLWHEINEIVESITTDGRRAQQIDITIEGESKAVLFTDPEGAIIAKYVMNDEGQLQMDREGDDVAIKTLTEHLDFESSNFANDKIEPGFEVSLRLTDQLFFRNISLETSTEIYPRN